jgi:Glycosyltransferase
MTNILYLSPYFWPEEIGTAPYSSDLAVWFKQHGFQIEVVAFRPHYPSPTNFSSWADGSRDRENYQGVPILRVPACGRGNGGVASRLRNDLAYFWFVLRNTVSGHYAGTKTVFVYVPGILGVFGAYIVKLFTKARVVTVVHDIESGLAKSVGIVQNRLLIRALQLLERIGLNCSDHIVVLTEGMKQELRGIGCSKQIDMIPIWAELPAQAPIPPIRPFKVVYSGNFGKKQGLFQLLPALQRLSDEKQPVEISMRGGGSERDAFEEAALQRGITTIRFEPLTPKAQFIGALQEAHVHLVPQALGVANYALPSKLISIMSAGRPFICVAEKDSLLDHLTKETQAGVCVQPSEDGEGLYKAILALMQQPERLAQMGEAGRRYVQENMDRADILKRFTDLI